MKIFSTKSIDAVYECHLAFGFRKVRDMVCKCKIKFLTNYQYNANLICSAFEQQAGSERQAVSDQLAYMQSSNF